jgi:hypothetical protein
MARFEPLSDVQSIIESARIFWSQLPSWLPEVIYANVSRHHAEWRAVYKKDKEGGVLLATFTLVEKNPLGSSIGDRNYSPW